MSRAVEARRGFVDRLESLRGVAAMMVAVGHCVSVFPVAGLESSAVQGLVTLFNGRAAVTIFFVLSGYVLGLSLRRSQQPFLRGFVEFGLRRLFRIYPALVASSLAILGYLGWTHREQIDPPTTEWFQTIYRTQPGWAAFWQNLMLRHVSLNQVAWTLRVELIGSALLPLFHALSQRLTGWGRWGLFVGLLGLGWGLQSRGGGLFFSFMFYLGYVLPEVGPPLCSWLARKHIARGAVGLALALCLVARWGADLQFVSYLVEGLAAALFVAALLYGPEVRLYRVLDTRLARFYGRISYSFYLLHFCTMYAVAIGMVSWFPHDLLTGHGVWWGLALAVVSVAVVTPLSWACYQWVERPGIALGKRVGNLLQGKSPLGP